MIYNRLSGTLHKSFGFLSFRVWLRPRMWRIGYSRYLVSNRRVIDAGPLTVYIGS